MSDGQWNEEQWDRIYDLEDENAQLKTRLHKSNGLANEVNILTRENKTLTAKLTVATEALTAIRDASTWAKSWDHTSHLNNKARVALAKIQEVE